MSNDRSRMDKRRRPFSRGAARPDSSSPSRGFTSREIAALLFEHPELRLGNDPASAQLTQMLAADPEDKDLQEMFGFIVKDRYRQFIASGDVFWGNYPPKGGIVYPADFISMARMPNGPVGVTISQTPQNIIFSGQTGAGKSSLLGNMLVAPRLLSCTRVITFVRKTNELRHLSSRSDVSRLITIFQLGDISISFLQPPPGVKDLDWVSECTNFTAQCYAIFSAHRLMTECAIQLIQNHPVGIYPTLRQLVERLAEYKPRDYFREGQYKSSILTCLSDLLSGTNGVFDCSSSSWLEVLTTTPGLAIIEAPALRQSHLIFLATYMMRWLYLRRINDR